MANPSPFSFLEDLVQSVQIPAPPAWLVEEIQRRLILMANHVLMQEPQAMQRLVRQKGRVVLAQWRTWTFKVSITPAGLLDLSDTLAPPDLCLVLSEESPLRLAQTVMRGDKPPVRIEGDVQLAAEVNWLADNVRWDVEEDLARIVGDAPAHMAAQMAQAAVAGLRQFLGSRSGGEAAAGAPTGTAA